MGIDYYNGFHVGDEVRRTSGEHKHHHVGVIAIIIEMNERHLRFDSDGAGYDPYCYVLHTPVNPLHELLDKRTTTTLFGGTATG